MRKPRNSKRTREVTEFIHQPRFLSLEEVLFLHQLGIQEFQGTPGLRDRGLLESSVAQPRAGVSGTWLHKYPIGMAAAYGFHIAKNHAFMAGNKRVAWAAMRAFLYREGFLLRVRTEDEVATMLGVADLCNWSVCDPSQLWDACPLQRRSRHSRRRRGAARHLRGRNRVAEFRRRGLIRQILWTVMFETVHSAGFGGRFGFCERPVLQRADPRSGILGQSFECLHGG